MRKKKNNAYLEFLVTRIGWILIGLLLISGLFLGEISFFILFMALIGVGLVIGSIYDLYKDYKGIYK
jgi:hypothetical protein